MVRRAGDPGQESPRTGLAAAIAAAQAGDEDAFRAVYRAVQPELLRYLRVQVGAAAEDVASEAWLHIARDLAGFRGDEAGFRAWAATIARHRAIDYLRHQQRQPAHPGVLPVEEAASGLRSGDDTAGSAVERLSTDAALALVARLPPDQAEAVVLRVVMGLDAKSAAKVLGKRSGAVRTAAYRGLRRLAEYLAEAEAGRATPQRGDAGDATEPPVMRARPERTPRRAGARVTPAPAPSLKDVR